MELDLGLVADFLALAAERHYGRAAARRHLSPSALTKRIQRLERQVGCALVERGPTGVSSMTPAGQRFAASARPLLAQAAEARAAARAETRPGVLRLGVPAGTSVVIDVVGAEMIVGRVCREFPELRVTGVEVPFPELTTCLPSHRVDVLFTNAAVPHRDVESFPLSIRSARIGLVGRRHPLADATEVRVEDLGETPILYNPEVPEENMSPLWLGDLRTRREARLLPVDARRQSHFLHHLAHGDAALVTYPVIAGPSDLGLRAIALAGAVPLPFYVARRVADRRSAVQALVDGLLAIAPTVLGAEPVGAVR